MQISQVCVRYRALQSPEQAHPLTSGGLQALAANPALTVIVRPDRVIAAVERRHRLPRLPWLIPDPSPGIALAS